MRATTKGRQVPDNLKLLTMEVKSLSTGVLRYIDKMRSFKALVFPPQNAIRLSEQIKNAFVQKTVKQFFTSTAYAHQDMNHIVPVGAPFNPDNIDDLPKAIDQRYMELEKIHKDKQFSENQVDTFRERYFEFLRAGILQMYNQLTKATTLHGFVDDFLQWSLEKDQTNGLRKYLELLASQQEKTTWLAFHSQLLNLRKDYAVTRNDLKDRLSYLLHLDENRWDFYRPRKLIPIELR
eukprot:scpid82365/ scgid11284/ 